MRIEMGSPKGATFSTSVACANNNNIVVRKHGQQSYLMFPVEHVNNSIVENDVENVRMFHVELLKTLRYLSSILRISVFCADVLSL